MTQERWRRIQALFHAVADLPPADQSSFLSRECADDELRREVQSMLAKDSDSGLLLDRGVEEVASRILNTDPFPADGQLGSYRIVKRLGEGGMGVVYLARRDDVGSVAAIKVLRDAWLSPERRQRFAAEQRTLAQLNHPSIARLYDAGTLTDGTPWFAMEYVKGVSITDYCAQRGASMNERLRLFGEVCEAVRHAHLHAIIHRDLKPSNIIVREDGAVRLLDFGIAKQLDAQADQTRTGLRMMTPAYAAPEQISGGAVGVYTDVYALGVVLYELLAGRLPFDVSNLSPGEAELLIAEREPEKPCGVADLDVLCLKAMQKDPARRYPSAEGMIRDIDHYLRGEPLEARPDTLGYRAGKFVRRHRGAVIGAALVSALLIALSAFFTVRLTGERNRALAEAQRTQRIQKFMLNLFQGGDHEAGPAQGLRVITLLDRGVVEASALNNEPAVQAELYSTLGSMYQKLGKLDRADSLLESALKEKRVVFRKDSLESAAALIALGSLRIDQDRLPEAETLTREGLEISRHHAPAGDPAIARAIVALGRVREQRGNYHEALKLLEEAVRLDSRVSVPAEDLAASLNELASVHFYTGRYSQAESLFRRVLDIHRGLYGARHPSVADDLLNLGAVQLDLGYYDRAEDFDRQGLALNLAYYGADHPQTAHNYTVLGRALVYEKRFDEAAQLLEKALAIQERVYGPESPQAASALNELGNTAYWRGELDQAASHFSRMAEIYCKVYNNHHYLIGIALSNLAGVWMQRKDYARAEELYRQALGAYTDTLPPESLNVGITQIKLGRALLREREYAKAENYSRNGYRILMKQANPSVSYLQNARADLAEIYDAVHQPDQARQFRDELARAEATSK
jgi:serine/threonine-protein kinase